MANFQTHIGGAVIASSLLASAAISLDLLDKQAVLIVWLLGAFGGILPDIDSDNSTSLEIIFAVLAVVLALFVAQWLSPWLSIVGLWLVAGLVFVLIRYLVINLFEKFTVHRGSLHSLLACLMFGLITIHLCYHSGSSELFAWYAGVSLVFGMLVHLCLDEMYSVDFAGRNLKRSFGSALKICSLDYPLATLAQVLICGWLIYQLPSHHDFLTGIQQPVRFWPDTEWQILQQWWSEIKSLW